MGVGPCEGGQSGHFWAPGSCPFSGLQDTFHSGEQSASSPQQTHHPTPQLGTEETATQGNSWMSGKCQDQTLRSVLAALSFISAVSRYNQLLHDIRGEKKISIILCESCGIKIKFRNENPLMPTDPPAHQTSPPDLSHLPVCPQVPEERDSVAIPVTSKCL